MEENKILSAAGKPRVFLVGDSTMQSYGKEREPQAGWGQMFWHFWKDAERAKSYPSPDSRFPQSMCYELDGVVLDNRAMAARSSRSFREEGRLADIAACMKEGDYLFLQFAHNDANQGKPERYVPAENFGDSLRYYVELCRQKKATCVLVTAIAMRNCEESPDGSFQISFPRYREAMLEFARREDLVAMDMGKATTEYLKNLGGEAARQLFLWVKPGEYPQSSHREGACDNAHLQERGALVFAGILAVLIRDYDRDGRLDEIKSWLKGREECLELIRQSSPIPSCEKSPQRLQ